MAAAESASDLRHTDDARAKDSGASAPIAGRPPSPSCPLEPRGSFNSSATSRTSGGWLGSPRDDSSGSGADSDDAGDWLPYSAESPSSRSVGDSSVDIDDDAATELGPATAAALLLRQSSSADFGRAGSHELSGPESDALRVMSADEPPILKLRRSVSMPPDEVQRMMLLAALPTAFAGAISLRVDEERQPPPPLLLLQQQEATVSVIDREGEALPRRSMDELVAYSPCTSRVELFYRLRAARQTSAWVRRERDKWRPLCHARMTIFEALERLDALPAADRLIADEGVDNPALLSSQHALRTAEALRHSCPEHDWMWLAGLLAGLGKVMLLPTIRAASPTGTATPDWAVLGESFPLGCRFDPSLTYSTFFAASPDRRRRALSTRCGVYTPGCGLNRVEMCWTQTEYLALVLAGAHTRLPAEARFALRHRNFLALGRGGAYEFLLNQADCEALPWMLRLRRAAQQAWLKPPCGDEEPSWQLLKPLYAGLIDKYFPMQQKEGLRW